MISSQVNWYALIRDIVTLKVHLYMDQDVRDKMMNNNNDESKFIDTNN